MEQQQPTVGRIVHYVDGDGNHLAAVIAKVWSPQGVNLGVFSEKGTVSGVTSVTYSENPAVKISWHWPERV
jgi:hypothetical protein